MSERRTASRHRTLKAGTIVFNNSSSVYSCTVRNVSKTGACLLMAGALSVPAQFDLMMDNERVPCTVRWRRTDRLGVRFGQPAAVARGAAALN